MRIFGLILSLALAFDASALSFKLPPPGNDIVGENFTVRTQRYEDTLPIYAQSYGLGFRELVAANPNVNPWVPGEGTEILIPVEFILPPGERKGVVINLAELRLYYFLPDGQTVLTYPLGIGREGWETPLTDTYVAGMVANPTWHPPASIRAEHAAIGDPLPASVPPGPDNPLGKYAVQLGIKGYFIHGSNKDIGVGMRVSHGCMRMYDPDIEEFAHRVTKGTPVRIINVAVKTGWKNGALYVEVHEPLEEQRKFHVSEEAVADAIQLARMKNAIEIDWNEAKAAAVRLSGMPTKVSTGEIASR